MAMLILLVGPKGSGKSHIGRVLERRLSVRFFHVEPLWMRYHEECRSQGREPSVAEGMSRVHPQVKQALFRVPRLCVETTGASPEILSGLLALAPAGRRLCIRVRAPRELCLSRIAARDPTHQIALSDARVREVHAASEAATVVAALELHNLALSDDQIVDRVAPLLPKL